MTTDWAPAPTPVPAEPPSHMRPLPYARDSAIAPMLADLIRGDLAAGYAILEWLTSHKRHLTFEMRCHQANALRVLIGELVTGASAIAYHYGMPLLPDSFASVPPLRPEAVWVRFVERVQSLFAVDLYEQDDVIRFVGEVIHPERFAGVARGTA